MLGVKFSDAAELMAAARFNVGVAEAHGCLVGALCASNDYSLARWLDELTSDEAAASDASISARTLLQTVFSETERALRGEQLEFAPLLPDDSAPLARRAESLAQWCQGFLYGFGSALAQGRARSAEIEEVLRDFTQIARASAGDSEPTEEDEEDYMEIVEYLRISVQTVYDELRPTLQ